MEKKGGSHVGFILSFTIFILFVVFLYVIFSPLNQGRNERELILSKLNEDIMRNISSEMTIITTKISGNPVPPICKYIEIQTDILNLVSNQNIRTKNADFKEIQSAYSVLGFIKIEWNTAWNGNDNKKFLKSYISKRIAHSNYVPSPVNKCNINLNDYQIVSVDTDNYAFKNNIEELKKEYENDMEKVKAHFNIPQGVNFWFNFTDKDKNINIAPKEINIPKKVNVYLKESSFQYVDNGNANINRGVLTIKLW